MQVTETLSQGLKREYNIVVPASDLASRLDAQLADLKTKVRINGFRPGKVPVAHLKRVYGRSVMADRRAGDDQRGQQADRRRQRPAPRAASRKIELPERQGRDRGGARGARRPRLQGRAGSAAEIRGRRIRRSSRSSGRSPKSRTARSRTALQRLAQDRRVYADRPGRRQGGELRSRHGRFRRHDRRRGVRGRHERGHRGGARLATPSSPASRSSCSASPPARSARSRRPSPRPTRCASSPASKANST